MSYTVIFSNTYDLSTAKLDGELLIHTKSKLQTSNDCIQVLPIMSQCCGLHVNNQRPDRIIVEEPKVIPKDYYDWILRNVIPCGGLCCSYSYANDKTRLFVTSKHFSEFIADNRRS